MVAAGPSAQRVEQASHGAPRPTDADGPSPPQAPGRVAVTMLGALPPWRGVAPYTRSLVQQLDANEELAVEFLDFSSLYPPGLYPGGDPSDRNGTQPRFRNVRLRRLLAWHNPLSWLWAGLTLRGDVVHAQWWSYILAPVYWTVLALARLRRRRVVLTLHNVVPHDAAPWQRWLFQSVFRFAHHFIVHSDRNARELVAAYPGAQGRVAVTPMGLHGATERRGLTKEAARRELGLPKEGPVLLAFGNIRPYKGLGVLLRAMRRLLDAGQDVTLAVVGQPWGDMSPYHRLIDDLGLGRHVRLWLEYVPEEQVETFFSAADIAVYPYTHFDAQSAAATLALTYGVAMVVSDVGGLPDLVDDSRAIVPASDAAALAEALLCVLSDDTIRAKLEGDSCRRAAEFDWSATGRRTAALYARLAAS